MKKYVFTGDPLRSARKKRNLSLTKLAERVNITPNHLGKIERGQANPYFLTIIVLCIELRLDPIESLLKRKKKSDDNED
ncbi:helix-turn-helix domain-containing protein [Niallia sp. 01092]|uniref:helix-turn-helix domain-containing protein n=1 Tax=unclassified Niallia TaxID=2837522 RepID=UPI003FD633AF